MKRIYILLICTVFFIGCEKMFKYDKLNSLSLNTPDDYNMAIAGLYNKLFKGIMGNDLIFIESIGNEDDLRVDCYDALYVIRLSENGPDSSPDCIFNLPSSIFAPGSTCGLPYLLIPDYSGPYKLLYQAIGDANDILSKAGNLNNLNPEYKKLIGEVYYIRAYCYFKLVRMYGQVPLVDNPDVNFTLAKPSFVQLYNFMASDLLKAISLLPNSNNEARVKYETPHKGTARAMLAEVYLTMGGYPVNDNNNYTLAASMAKEVIDSAAYYGFGLMPDLADLWNGQNERNQESIFSCYDFNYIIKPAPSSSYVYSSNAYCSYSVSHDFYNSFPNNYRKECSFQTRQCLTKYYWDSVTHTDDHFDTTIVYLDTISYHNRVNYKKFYSQFDIPIAIIKNSNQTDFIENTPYTGHVVYMFRYAQTLLTYAEAKARSGIVDDLAYNAINQVRRRANKVDINTPSKFDLQPGLSPQQFADSVVQERAWELCAEPEGRWYDMLRLGLTKNLVQIKLHQGIMVYPFL